MPTPNSKLVHVLIGKSIVETLLIGALAVVTFIMVFPPHFHGWGEVTDQAIAGWAVNNAEPYQRVPVQLFINGEFVASAVADVSRPDVSAAGWARDPWHGYIFRLPSLPAGRHEARIYAAHDSGDGKRKSLQLLGNPLIFTISEGTPVKGNETK
jgi:hypothetical protein